jgi:carbon-monoxide dehydrogenase medium subunit
MKPARFKYERPASLSEALTLLSDTPDAAILAGGQSLMPMLNFRMSRPSALIDINCIPGLDRIEVVDGALTIGAAARHNNVLRSQQVQECVPLLALALPFVAHEAIRNRGTIGGSLALADAAAELPCCCVCLGAEIVATSHNGERRINAEDFFQGIYATSLRPDEIITSVRFPLRDNDWLYSFDEIARRRGDFAMAGLALAVKLRGREIAEIRITYCGVEAAPRRLPDIESKIVGERFYGSDFLTPIRRLLAQTLEPMDSRELPASYRIHLAGVLLERGLRSVMGERVEPRR